MFDDICLQLHETAVKKGFWSVLEDATQEQTDIFVTKQLMMIVSEAVEVMEAIRKDKGEDEIADEIEDEIGDVYFWLGELIKRFDQEKIKRRIIYKKEKYTP